MGDSGRLLRLESGVSLQLGAFLGVWLCHAELGLPQAPRCVMDGAAGPDPWPGLAGWGKGVPASMLCTLATKFQHPAKPLHLSAKHLGRPGLQQPTSVYSLDPDSLSGLGSQPQCRVLLRAARGLCGSGPFPSPLQIC